MRVSAELLAEASGVSERQIRTIAKELVQMLREDRIR